MNRKILIATLALITSLSDATMQGEEVYHNVEYFSETAIDLCSGDWLPYFLAANRQGILSPQGSQGYIRGAIDYHRQREGKKFYWNAGADLIVYASSHYDYYRNNNYLQQFYAEIGGGQYFLTIGSKERPPRFVNADLSSGNMAWSGNTRPVPGVHFGTRDFVKMFIIDELLEGSFDFYYGRMQDGHYNNTRFSQYQSLGTEGPLRISAVDGAYLHRKSVFLRTPSKLPFYITAGLEHTAVFGGMVHHIDGIWDGPRELVTFEQTCKWGNALMGGEGRINDALNHLMTIDARMDFKTEQFEIGFYKQHYTDDLNAKSFKNFSDGLWGMELKLPRLPWINHLVVEYIQTNSQGDNTRALQKIQNGEELYVEDFASDFYQDERFGGYAYYGMTCGTPMVVSPIYNTDSYTGMLHNNILGIHLGAAGWVNRSLSYKVKFCSFESEGNPWTSALLRLAGHAVPRYSNVSFLLDLTYNYGRWDFASQLSFDHGDLLGKNFGIGITARYSGKWLKAIWK